MSNFRRLLSYARPYRWQFVGILFLGIIASLFQPGLVLGIKPIVEGVFVGKNESFMRMIPFAIAGFALFFGITRYIYLVWVDYLSEKIVRKIRLQLYAVYTSLSLDHYSKASSGKMMSVMSNDITFLLEAYAKVADLCREPFTILGLLGVAFYHNWKMTLLSLLIIPPVVFCIARIGSALRKMTRKRQEQWATLNATVHETLSGIRIVKTFNLEPLLQKRFRQDNDRLLAILFEWIKIEKLSSPLLAVLGGFGIAFFVYYSGVQVLTEAFAMSDLLSMGSVGAAFGMLLNPVKRLNSLNIAFQKAMGASERVFLAIDLKPSVMEKQTAVSLGSFQKSILFDRVSFKYDEAWILDDIELQVDKGDVVALVGSSGVGKTTLVNLIPRLYDVSRGSIAIDGVDIREVTLRSLREQISIVSQDVFLFNDTVAANISYGKPNTLLDNIIKAAQAANAHAFISELPEGYDTVIGERGVKLSGGQRQRISIARALLKNAPILILDEATSSLDTESEILVQKAIDKLMRGRTCFIIAHRLSTIQHADRIVALDKGKIAEMGSHEELMAKQGVYYRFYQLQFSAQLTAVGKRHSYSQDFHMG